MIKFSLQIIIIKRIELRKQTHEGTIEDTQSIFDTHVTRYNEKNINKKNLKAQVEQLTMMLTKITKSLEIIEPIISSIDEQVIKQAEHVTPWSRAIGKWMDRMLGQGIHLLSSIITLINNLESVNSEVDKTPDLLSQELETREMNSNAWLKLEDFDLQILLDNEVLPTQNMDIE